MDKADNLILFRKTHSYKYRENVIEIHVTYSKIGIHWFGIHTIRNRFSNVMWLVMIFHQNCKTLLFLLSNYSCSTWIYGYHYFHPYFRHLPLIKLKINATWVFLINGGWQHYLKAYLLNSKVYFNIHSVVTFVIPWKNAV